MTTHQTIAVSRGEISRAFARALGQTQQPAPDTAGWPAFAENALSVTKQENGALTTRQGFPSLSPGQFFLSTITLGKTASVQRARLTERFSARANRRPEIHHPLRIALDIAFRQRRFGQRPQRALVAGGGIAPLDGETARQDALDIAVENRRPAAKSENGNGGGGGTADSRQARANGGVAGKKALMHLPHRSSAAVQMTRARVVAKAGP